MLRDDAFGDIRHAADGGIREVEVRLLVLHEAAIESAASLMARIGADDRESAREAGIAACRGAAERRLDGAVQPSAALEQEATVPGLRKRQRESDAVGDARGAGAAIDYTVKAAVRRQIRRGRSATPSARDWRAGGKPLGLGDGQCDARHLKLHERRARGGGGAPVCAAAADPHRNRNPRRSVGIRISGPPSGRDPRGN